MKKLGGGRGGGLLGFTGVIPSVMKGLIWRFPKTNSKFSTELISCIEIPPPRKGEVLFLLGHFKIDY